MPSDTMQHIDPILGTHVDQVEPLSPRTATRNVTSTPYTRLLRYFRAQARKANRVAEAVKRGYEEAAAAVKGKARAPLC